MTDEQTVRERFNRGYTGIEEYAALDRLVARIDELEAEVQTWKDRATMAGKLEGWRNNQALRARLAATTEALRVHHERGVTIVDPATGECVSCRDAARPTEGDTLSEHSQRNPTANPAGRPKFTEGEQG